MVWYTTENIRQLHDSLINRRLLKYIVIIVNQDETNCPFSFV